MNAVKLNWCIDCRVNCYMSQFMSTVKLNWCTDRTVNCYMSKVEFSKSELV